MGIFTECGRCEQLKDEIARLRDQLAATECEYKSFRDTAEAEFRSLCNRLKVSVDYADGIPAGYGEDEIDRQQAEIERLKKQCQDLVVDAEIIQMERLMAEDFAAKRGARMQIIRNWMENKGEDWKMEISTDKIWEWFLYAHPEAADWFDENGVPKRER